jgi:hypothetical protein
MKHLLLFSIFCLACTHSSRAQFGIRPLSSSNQQLIEEAVKEGIFIVRRSYQLKDSLADPPQYYGWNHAPNFGETCSMGVKTTNGYYLDDKAVYPWKYDPKFEEYSRSKQYVPVISQSEYRPYHPLTDSAFIPFPYPNGVSTGESFHFVADSLFGNKGFPLDDSDGLKQGWLVWLVSADSLENASAESLSLLIYRNELTFEAGKSTYKIEAPSTHKKVLGGLYIVPQIEGIGKITFYLSGLGYAKDGQWQIVRLGDPVAPESGSARSEEATITPPGTSKKTGLTPSKRINE